jgi:hypothetical protein
MTNPLSIKILHYYSKESLRLKDEPLRRAAIEKATKDHQKELLEKERINKGN